MGNTDSKGAPDNASTVVSMPSKEESRYTSYDGTDDGDTYTPQTTFSEEKSVMPQTPTRKGWNRKSDIQERDDDHQSVTTHITDDEVHVNLAMADLMAYLQVVANNSNNLPLTKRDDSELERTVLTLTSEEYARKSAAFVPSDIRVIGGSFTRYGRVWDLPSSEVRSLCSPSHILSLLDRNTTLATELSSLDDRTEVHAAMPC
jgi:hypothetical protein